MTGRRVASIVVLVCILKLPGWPQDREKGQSAPKPQLRVFFSKLETQWLSAIQDKDPAALNLFVSDDFHLWTSSPPGSPLGRSGWWGFLAEGYCRSKCGNWRCESLALILQ